MFLGGVAHRRLLLWRLLLPLLQLVWVWAPGVSVLQPPAPPSATPPATPPATPTCLRVRLPTLVTPHHASSSTPTQVPQNKFVSVGVAGGNRYVVVLHRVQNLTSLFVPALNRFSYSSSIAEIGVWLPLSGCYSKRWMYLNTFESRNIPSDTEVGAKSVSCISLPGVGLNQENYRCECVPGYQPYALETTANLTIQLTSFYRCAPECMTDELCSSMFSETLIRALIISVQVGCMCFTVIVAIIIFKKRKCKTIATGMWTVLEMILLGIFILYFSVIVYVFKPSTERCILEPWGRELGFVVCYGAIVLKLYRILMEFRTRKARRWVVRDKDLLTYLLGMVVVVVAYLAAWTVSVLNFLQEGFSILIRVHAFPNPEIVACKPLWWDHVTQIAELMFLLFGLQLGYAARNASVQFNERTFLSGAVFVEILFSSVFYVIRILYWSAMSPTNVLVVAFIRSQLTNSLVLLLIFSPKFWYQQKQTRDFLEHSLNHELSDVIKADKDGILFTEVEVTEISISEMNPDDIKTELKRVYTQLEVLKNKTLRYNNPHISKKRGGRKVAHRRFSLQTLLRNRSFRFGRGVGEHSDGCEVEVSRTPEESVCSIEGQSCAIYYDPPSALSEGMAYSNPRELPKRAKQHELTV
nr:PREDICTED: probable G-protein coupled receptor 158 [Bemisia tabaci]